MTPLYRDDPQRDLTRAELEALRDGGFAVEGEDLGENDPLARTAAEYAALVQTSLTTAQAAARLRVEPSRIRQRLTESPPTLYGIRLGSGWRIPEFQFEGDDLLPGWSEVAAALDPELHPIAVYRWLTTPNVDLEDQEGRRLSPRDWLRLGHKPSTVRVIDRTASDPWLVGFDLQAPLDLLDLTASSSARKSVPYPKPEGSQGGKGQPENRCSRARDVDGPPRSVLEAALTLAAGLGRLRDAGSAAEHGPLGPLHCQGELGPSPSARKGQCISWAMTETGHPPSPSSGLILGLTLATPRPFSNR